MTANQINYQKAVAESAERREKTRQMHMANEMQHLQNLQEKYWHYGISPQSYEDQKVVKNAFMLEAYDRGIAKAKDLLGLFGSAGSVLASGKTGKGK